jgi:hypothetical protein
MGHDAQPDVYDGKIRVVRLRAWEAAERMLHAAPRDTYLGISAKLPGFKAGTDGPYLHPFGAPTRDEFMWVVDTAIDAGAEAVYTMLATFRYPVAYPKRQQPYSFPRSRCDSILGLMIDLDVGRSESEARDTTQTMSADDALAIVFRLVEQDAIPLPTLTARSGRGLYLLYIFSAAARYTEHLRRRFEAVHDELRTRLAGLCPDRSSRNVVQLFKAPGSLSAAGFVSYEMYEQGEIGPPLHTLESLQTFLMLNGCVTPEEKLIPARRKGSRPRSPRQRVAFARRRMDELERLVPLRKRWTGWRHYLLLAYAEAARHVCRADHGPLGDELAAEIVLDFNRGLPDPEDECAIRTQVLASPLPRRPQQNKTIVRNLEITVAESLSADMKSLAHPELVSALQGRGKERAEEKKRRNEQIDALLREGATVRAIMKQTAVSRAAIYRRKKWRPS